MPYPSSEGLSGLTAITMEVQKHEKSKKTFGSAYGSSYDYVGSFPARICKDASR
jgi:hypothetical protein